MLQEAFEYIRDLAAQGIKPVVVEIPGDKRTVLVADSSGTKERAIPAPLRSHKVATVEDLARLATHASKGIGGDNTPTVWHGFAAVTLLWDDEDRRDRVTLPLEHTDEWKVIASLGRQSPMGQREIIRLLRVDLCDCINLPSLITSLRKIKFKTASSGGANIQHGNESLGREIEAEVSGIDGSIPEQVTLQVRVYKNFGEDERWPVRCDLEIDPHKQEFVFRPLPADVNEAQLLAQGSIRQRLQTALTGAVPVYFGEP